MFAVFTVGDIVGLPALSIRSCDFLFKEPKNINIYS
jgi:hypothetical protein